MNEILGETLILQLNGQNEEMLSYERDMNTLRDLAESMVDAEVLLYACGTVDPSAKKELILRFDELCRTLDRMADETSRTFDVLEDSYNHTLGLAEDAGLV